MFEKILIANRGEIACRVIRTAKRLGVSTVAVYSEADREALHVAMADESVLIGPAPSSESYLVVDRIIDACRQTGAQAVHPGYGFLSENPALFAGLESEGIVFIGPSKKAIEVMGDKIASKALAEASGVSTVPGFNHVIPDADEAIRCARKIGYPVMLKASAGGGGKGMRIAHSDEECREGFERASSEARSSFADDRIFIEKFISQPRHIEIQVLADQHGHVIHLNERECSIQRRHQKVVEEAPSPFVDDALRQAMGAQAIDLARAVNYVSAGTVEFIVDAERKFYFLEMNTRLQVEHPVTEKITGIDLVEWMLRIAAGEKLTLSQHDVGISGWSMETRIYAEDPLRGFMPSSGRVTRFRPPEASETVRIDTGLFEGAEVSLHYDPMVAKLISHGPDRDQAADTMRRALDQFEIRGIQANTAFLTALIESPRFRAGETTTAFIEEEFGQGFTGEALDVSVLDGALAVVSLVHELRHRDRQPMAFEPERAPSPAKICRIARTADQTFEIALQEEASGWSVLIGSRVHRFKVLGNPYDSVVDFEFDGHSGSAQIRRSRNAYEVIHGGSRFTVAMFEPHVAQLASIMPKKIQPDRSHLVLSPMPGLLVSLSVNAGDTVKAGDEVAVVEAMKMENILRANRDGRVAVIHAKVGAALNVDQCIVELDQEPGE